MDSVYSSKTKQQAASDVVNTRLPSSHHFLSFFRFGQCHLDLHVFSADNTLLHPQMCLFFFVLPRIRQYLNSS